jgi:hypothetical protein
VILTALMTGYAVDGIKHCVRAADMGGKSGVVLLRQIHPHLIKEVSVHTAHAPTGCLLYAPTASLECC